MQRVKDSYSETFDSFSEMAAHYEQQSKESVWESVKVNEIQITPLEVGSPLVSSPSLFHSDVSATAIVDTIDNLGLAAQINGVYYPLRNTAYKSLLDRAKINGTVLPKLSRSKLADTLNYCLAIHEKAQALILIRNEKVSAVHSGDKRDYSVLPIDELLKSLNIMLNDRFPGTEMVSGYCDHSLTGATFELRGHVDEMLEDYKKVLDASGHAALSKQLMPALRFQTSDVGISSARVSAYLTGFQTPISIGSVVSVDHRREAKVENFTEDIQRIYAQYRDQVDKLMKLTSIRLDYPVNAMIAACKKLAPPKKAALEAISMFEMSWSNGDGTAHDVFLALQEIPFLLKSDGFPQRKLFETEEKLAGAVSLNWNSYDTAKAVSY